MARQKKKKKTPRGSLLFHMQEIGDCGGKPGIALVTQREEPGLGQACDGRMCSHARLSLRVPVRVPMPCPVPLPVRFF